RATTTSSSSSHRTIERTNFIRELADLPRAIAPTARRSAALPRPHNCFTICRDDLSDVEEEQRRALAKENPRDSHDRPFGALGSGDLETGAEPVSDLGRPIAERITWDRGPR
ncbi:MAG: hypothetical protein ACJ74R_00920, partial [Gaiellaceae bacterium]